MNMPLVLARFWGLALIAICGPLLINQRGYANVVERIKEEIVFLFSLIAIFLGAFSVSILNSWTADFKGVITLLGWSSLLKGCLGMLFPQTWISLIGRFGRYRALMVFLFALFLTLGIWLLTIGFRY